MSRRKLAGIIMACTIAAIAAIVLFSVKPWERTPSAETYTLTTVVSPSGSGSVFPSGGEYESGAQLTITASPAIGYTFDHWSGSAPGNASTITITMESDKNLTASFKAQNETSQEEYAPDEIVLRFKPGVNQTVQDELLQSYNLTKIGEIPGINVLVLKVDPNELDAMIEALSHNPNVEFAERNYIVHAAGPDDLPYVPDQILIRFKPGVSQAVQDELLQIHNLTKIDELPQINVLLLKVNPNELDAVIEALSHNLNVEFAERNYIGQVAEADYLP